MFFLPWPSKTGDVMLFFMSPFWNVLKIFGFEISKSSTNEQFSLYYTYGMLWSWWLCWDINIWVLDDRQPVITEYVMNGINENKIIYIWWIIFSSTLFKLNIGEKKGKTTHMRMVDSPDTNIYDHLLFWFGKIWVWTNS